MKDSIPKEFASTYARLERLGREHSKAFPNALHPHWKTDLVAGMHLYGGERIEYKTNTPIDKHIEVPNSSGTWDDWKQHLAIITVGDNEFAIIASENSEIRILMGEPTTVDPATPNFSIVKVNGKMSYAILMNDASYMFVPFQLVPLSHLPRWRKTALGID